MAHKSNLEESISRVVHRDKWPIPFTFESPTSLTSEQGTRQNFGHLNFGSSYPNLIVDPKPSFYDLVENNCHYEMTEIKDPVFVWDFLAEQNMEKYQEE